MKKELELALVRDFPALYKQYGGPMNKTCMHWGFTCGDGWEPLIRELSISLTELANKSGKNIEAAQVKEKFGGLRFYLDVDIDINKEAFDITREAESKSYSICEWCGVPGSLDKSRSYIKTLCEDCKANRTEIENQKFEEETAKWKAERNK